VKTTSKDTRHNQGHQSAGADGCTEPGLRGERLARFFLEKWEDPDTRRSLMAVLRGALTHQESARLLREFLGQQVFRQLADRDGNPPDPYQIELAASHLIGVALLRYGLELEPIASQSVDSIVERVAPTLDSYLGGPSGLLKTSASEGGTPRTVNHGCVQPARW
jgi:Tetracyclin repressor-like, C-terminal domain